MSSSMASLVDADVEGFAEFLEGELALRGAIASVGAAEELIPDVLRLPQVYVEGHGCAGRARWRGRTDGRLRGSPDLTSACNWTMARLMRSAAAKLSAAESMATWSVEARRKSASIPAASSVRLDGAAQAGVDGEVGGDGKRGRRAAPDSVRKWSKRGVVFVDLAQRVFHLGHGLVENRAQDALLLIGEERGERVAMVPKKRSMRRITSEDWRAWIALRMSLAKAAKAAPSPGRRWSSGARRRRGSGRPGAGRRSKSPRSPR